jgi:DNA polymerase III gamma/tau subunit
MTIADPAPGFRSLDQATPRTIARRAAARGTGQRTLLVQGPAGSGKGAFVDDLLALLFCTAADRAGRPCNACRGCRHARARTHPDLLIGGPDRWRELRSSTESQVATARAWLLESAGAPLQAERRVVLVEGADRASEQVQNVLLKALEEPGERQMFVLVADDPARLLPTIRSRCQPLRIGPVPRADLTAWLVDVERVPADQADILARLSDGLIGTAVRFLRQPDLLAWRRRTQAELLGLLERGRADRFVAARELLDHAVRLVLAPPPDLDPAGDPDEAVRTPSSQLRDAALLVVEAWTELSRDLLVAALGRPELARSADLHDDLDAVARRCAPVELSAMLDLLERIAEGLRQSAAPRLALERAMLAWPRLAVAGR